VSTPGDRTPGGVFFLEEEDPDKTSSMIARCVSESIPEQFGIQARDIQVLIPMHKGSVGTQNLNSLLQDKLNHELVSVIKHGDRTFKLGDRVRQTKNDAKREIVNGDLGYICEVFDKSMGQEPPADQPKAVLAVKLESSSLEERIFYCTKSDLGNLQLAYAGTVHSSQGGEYPAVVIGLTRGHWIMLSRTLLYTALTRAKKLCVIVGDKIALKRACENSKSEDRVTLLARLI
jgi:exodeoxyribonuclease V alpha subunit